MLRFNRKFKRFWKGTFLLILVLTFLSFVARCVAFVPWNQSNITAAPNCFMAVRCCFAYRCLVQTFSESDARWHSKHFEETLNMKNAVADLDSHALWSGVLFLVWPLHSHIFSFSISRLLFFLVSYAIFRTFNFHKEPLCQILPNEWKWWLISGQSINISWPN